MPSPTPESEFTHPSCDIRPWKEAGVATRVNLLGAAALVAVAVAYLAPQWRQNPDLAHGWLTPLVFIFLIQEARTRGTPRYLRPSAKVAAAAALAAGLGLLLLGAAGLFMAALEWRHSLVAATFTAGLCCLLVSTWLACSTNDERLLPFNWTAAVALLLWLLSTPLPPGTYATLTQALQTFVTSVVLSLLHFFGVAAVQHGNIIQLPRTAVGVEEACSGIRSLLTCVYAGFLFSAVWVRRPAARIFLICLSGVLAIGMNLVRSLLLTLLAYGGIEIEGAWHDVTGYAIVVATAVVLIAVAHELGKSRDHAAEAPTPAANPAPQPANNPAWVRRLLAAGNLVALAWVAFLFFAVQHAAPTATASPNLATLLPENCEGWTAHREKEIYRFASQLQTDTLTQTTYYREDGLELTVYLAYWPAGKVPVSLVASHTPDACWPGSGWSALATPHPRVALGVGDRSLAPAEHRIFTQNEQIQHVWYWHLYDGRVIHPDDVRSPRHLLSLAWEYGFRRTGDQLFVRISSNQPWDRLENEPLVREIFARLKAFGL